ncbi:21746_t:CDS:2 [Gigaspora margarita]|uniref:21746_t:CDS:1 n=1 Tax=Gigaspora margarita TaxID=4874 RepID=A0ABN7UTD8_GIGMA|nr:21746_t:CDS:2 [Gigaspora margarita]
MQGKKKSFKHLSKCLHNKETWAKKEEEILNSIKEDLKQKEIDLGPNGLRKVFIPRNKEEYRNQHIEWPREFLADDIGLALERMNLSKNKAQDIAVTFFDKWLTFFQKEEKDWNFSKAEKARDQEKEEKK